MLKKIIPALMVLWCTQCWGASYYIKTGGNNSSDGLSHASAWADFTNVDGVTFSGTNTFYLRYGDTFTVNTPVNVVNSNMTLSAYDSGEVGHTASDAKPIITSWTTRTTGTWTDKGGNIWLHSQNMAVSGTTRVRLGNSTETDMADDGAVNEWDNVSANLNWYVNSHNSENYNLYVYATQDPYLAYNSTGGIQYSTCPYDMILCENVNNITIENIEFRGGQYRVIKFHTCDNVVVKDCKFYDMSGYFVYCQYVTNSKIYDNEFDSNFSVTYRENSIQKMTGYDMIYLGSGCKYNKVYNNTFEDTLHCAVSLSTTSTLSSDRIEYNNVYSNFITNNAGYYHRAFGTGGPSDMCRYNVIEGNYIVGQSVRSQFLGNNNTIRNNIWIDGLQSSVKVDVSQAFELEEYSGQIGVGNTIVNNTIIEMYDEGILFSGGSYDDNIVENNIIMDCDQAGSDYQIVIASATGRSGNICKNNIIYSSETTTTVYDKGTARTVASWEANFGSEFSSVSGNITTNPNLLSDGMLQAGSSAINSGLDVSNPLDYRGILRDETPDIGAYEYIGGLQIDTSVEGVTVT